VSPTGLVSKASDHNTTWILFRGIFSMNTGRYSLPKPSAASTPSISINNLFNITLETTLRTWQSRPLQNHPNPRPLLAPHAPSHPRVHAIYVHQELQSYLQLEKGVDKFRSRLKPQIYPSTPPIHHLQIQRQSPVDTILNSH
jgi:hypothetical protein